MDSKKSFCRSVTEGTWLTAYNGTGLQNKSFQDRAEISKAYILSVLVK